MANAKLFICNADMQLNKLGGKPILLKHFFQQESLTVSTKPTEPVDLTTEDGEWQEQLEQQEDDILEFGQLDLDSMRDYQSAMLNLSMPPQDPSPKSPSLLIPSDIPKIHTHLFIPPPT